MHTHSKLKQNHTMRAARQWRHWADPLAALRSSSMRSSATHSTCLSISSNEANLYSSLIICLARSILSKRSTSRWSLVIISYVSRIASSRSSSILACKSQSLRRLGWSRKGLQSNSILLLVHTSSVAHLSSNFSSTSRVAILVFGCLQNNILCKTENAFSLFFIQTSSFDSKVLITRLDIIRLHNMSIIKLGKLRVRRFQQTNLVFKRIFGQYGLLLFKSQSTRQNHTIHRVWCRCMTRSRRTA